MTSDTFSIHRVGMLYNFYRPAIRLVLIIATVAVLASYLLCLYSAQMTLKYDVGVSSLLIYSFGSTVVSLVYFMGPFVLTQVKERGIATTLPASWQEKSVFTFSWIFIIFPVYLAALWYGASAICSIFTPAAKVGAVMGNALTGGIDLSFISDKGPFYNYVSYVCINTITTFVILSSRRNRLAYGIAANIVSNVAITITTAVTAAFIAIKFVLDHKTNETDLENPQLIINMLDMMKYVAFVLIAIALFFIFACVRKIKNRQN